MPPHLEVGSRGGASCARDDRDRLRRDRPPVDPGAAGRGGVERPHDDDEHRVELCLRAAVQLRGGHCAHDHRAGERRTGRTGSRQPEGGALLRVARAVFGRHRLRSTSPGAVCDAGQRHAEGGASAVLRRWSRSTARRGDDETVHRGEQRSVCRARLHRVQVHGRARW